MCSGDIKEASVAGEECVEREWYKMRSDSQQEDSHIGLYAAAVAAAAAAKSLQLCLTLCDPIEGSPPGSPVPGMLQARTLEWGAIAFSDSSL